MPSTSGNLTVAEPDLVPPSGDLLLADAGRNDLALVAAVDRTARHWTGEQPGPLRPGTDTHANATWRMFRETFNPYKPTIIDWPKLDPEARDRLVNPTAPCWVKPAAAALSARSFSMSSMKPIPG